MAITTPELKALLETIWKTCPDTGKTLRQAIQEEGEEIRSLGRYGTVINSGGSTISGDGRIPGSHTTDDASSARQRLLELHDTSKVWLFQCARYGLDPYVTERDGWPNPNPTIAASPVLLDTEDRWFALCITTSDPGIGIDSSAVVGQPIKDETIFVWMFDHLIPAYESHGDFSRLLIGAGMQFT